MEELEKTPDVLKALGANTKSVNKSVPGFILSFILVASLISLFRRLVTLLSKDARFEIAAKGTVADALITIGDGIASPLSSPSSFSVICLGHLIPFSSFQPRLPTSPP